MDIYLAFGIIAGAVLLIMVAAFVAAQVIAKKQQNDSVRSIPKGADETATSALLQERYRRERDQGEFTRMGFDQE